MPNFIFSEMLTHPALFSHPKAQKIAIIDADTPDLLAEVLKHSNIKEIHVIQKNPPPNVENQDSRVHFHKAEGEEWLAHQPSKSIDILIIASNHAINNPSHFQSCYKALNTDGILVQLCTSPFDLAILVNTHQLTQNAGFADSQILNFPGQAANWQSAMLSIKQGHFKRLSEKTIFNKKFTTQYYNFDIHKAALALPEFVREKITI